MPRQGPLMMSRVFLTTAKASRSAVALLVDQLDRLMWKAFHVLQHVVSYEWNATGYGWKEAVFYPTNVDTWVNHSSVLTKLLEGLDPDEDTSLLDVGAGEGGFADLIGRSKRCPNLAVTILDMSVDRIRVARVGKKVLADSRCLPIKSGSYDYVTSIDCEGLLDERSIHEMVRVSRRRIILHFPVEGDGGIFAGGLADAQFQQRHVKSFGYEEAWTASVLEMGHPRLDRLREMLPGLTACGTESVDVWLRHMVNARRPVLRFFTGIWYLMTLKRRDTGPPYRGCVAVYEK